MKFEVNLKILPKLGNKLQLTKKYNKNWSDRWEFDSWASLIKLYIYRLPKLDQMQQAMYYPPNHKSIPYTPISRYETQTGPVYYTSYTPMSQSTCF